MICKNERRRSVANAELWSNTLTRCSRHQHAVSLLHLSELDFLENTCARKCSECSKQSSRIFQTRSDCVRHDVFPCPGIGSDPERKVSVRVVLETKIISPDWPRIRSTRRIIFNEHRRDKRQVPRIHLLNQTWILEFCQTIACNLSFQILCHPL